MDFLGLLFLFLDEMKRYVIDVSEDKVIFHLFNYLSTFRYYHHQLYIITSLQTHKSYHLCLFCVSLVSRSQYMRFTIYFLT